MIFQTTNAPMPVLLPFITTWSSMYTLFAQQALFFESCPSVLSCSVIAPAAIDSTEILEKDLWCDCTQYGGEVTGEMTDESLPSCAFLEGDVVVSSLLLFEPAASPFTLALLDRSFLTDSIHLRVAAPKRRNCEIRSGIQDGEFDI